MLPVPGRPRRGEWIVWRRSRLARAGRARGQRHPLAARSYNWRAGGRFGGRLVRGMQVFQRSLASGWYGGRQAWETSVTVVMLGKEGFQHPPWRSSPCRWRSREACGFFTTLQLPTLRPLARWQIKTHTWRSIPARRSFNLPTECPNLGPRAARPPPPPRPPSSSGRQPCQKSSSPPPPRPPPVLFSHLPSTASPALLPTTAPRRSPSIAPVGALPSRPTAWRP